MVYISKALFSLEVPGGNPTEKSSTSPKQAFKHPELLLVIVPISVP